MNLPINYFSQKKRPTSNQALDWHRVLPYIFLTIILFTIYIARIATNYEVAVGAEPYLHARLARSFETRGVMNNDHLVVGGQPIPFTPYKATVIFISRILPENAAVILAPILFGVIVLISFNKLLFQLGKTPIERTIALSILVLTPTFLHDVTITGPSMAVIAFQLSFATLILEQKLLHKIAGIGAALLSSSFSPLSALATIILGLFLTFKKPKRWMLITCFTISSIIGTTFIPPEYQQTEFARTDISQALSDLGGLSGLPTFTILLSLIGLWILGPKKTSRAALVIIIIGAIFDQRLISLANVVLATLSGAAIYYLMYRPWIIKDLKYFALLIITCGIIFSTISAGARIVTFGPTNSIASSLEWLRGHSRSGEVVLSTPENGHWIQYFATRPVVIDQQSKDFRLGLLQKAFTGYNLKSLATYLDNTKTAYILITPDMTQGGVWNSKGKGMHYLLSNHETFKKIYENEGIEIYEYLNKPPYQRL